MFETDVRNRCSKRSLKQIFETEPKGTKMTSYAIVSSPAQVARTASAVSRPRLSRKARRVRSVVLLALVITGFNMFAQYSSGAQASNQAVSSSAVSASVHYVSVRSGDTLWTMAETYAPNSDPREWIDKVVSLNNLSSIDLVAGQRIAVPKN
jgi:LysM repeat protein